MLGLALSLLLGAPWSEPVHTAFEDACLEVYADLERAPAFCDCMQRHAEAAITEAELVEFAHPERTPVDAKVGGALQRAESACRDEMAGAALEI